VATFHLGNIAYKTGDHDSAVARYEASLVGFREIGNKKRGPRPRPGSSWRS
jgi:hypothetical protein